MRLEGDRSPSYNMMYTAALDLRNMVDVSSWSRLRRCSARRPEARTSVWTFRISATITGCSTFFCGAARGRPRIEKKPVVFRYKTAEECQRYKK